MFREIFKTLACAGCAAALLLAGSAKYRDWPAYGGGPEVMRYSSL
jgi:hypothetical protein